MDFRGNDPKDPIWSPFGKRPFDGIRMNRANGSFVAYRLDHSVRGEWFDDFPKGSLKGWFEVGSRT
jgi:hypothetical protein